MQVSKKFQDIQFQLNNSQLWAALFDSATDMPSIQSPTLSYRKIKANWIAELEISIERFIVDKFESWRRGIPTRWNRMASKTLKQLLTKFEAQTVAGISIDQIVTQSVELAQLKKLYKIQGLPLNIAYTDVPACSEKVFNTDVHLNVNNGVEFSLAVHCHGYAGSFTSVWIFICSLVR